MKELNKEDKIMLLTQLALTAWEVQGSEQTDISASLKEDGGLQIALCGNPVAWPILLSMLIKDAAECSDTDPQDMGEMVLEIMSVLDDIPMGDVKREVQEELTVKFNEEGEKK